MSNPLASVAASMVASVADVLSRLSEISGLVAKDESNAVSVSDLTKAIDASTDAKVVAFAAEIAEATKVAHEANARVHAARKNASAVLFPSAVPSLSDDERATLVAEGRGLRTALKGTYDAAKLLDPEVTLPTIPDVVGIRGRKPGSVSTKPATSRPRVAAITLNGEANDGSDIVIGKHTFGALRSEIKSVVGIDVDNVILIDAYVAAAGAESWDKVAEGTVTKVTVTSGEREITYTVTR